MRLTGSVALLLALGGPLAAAPQDYALPEPTAQLRAPADPAHRPGFEAAQGNCMVCHSVDYIAMQPPRKGGVLGVRGDQDGQGLPRPRRRGGRQGHRRLPRRHLLRAARPHWVRMIWMTAGVMITTNSTGRKNRIIGTVSFGGSAAAFFSASIMRRSRLSWLTPQACPTGVP